MSTPFFFQYPTWYILLCGVFAAAVSFILYFKSEFLGKEGPSTHPKTLILLTIFRFISIFVVSLFLLSPFIRAKKTEIQKPEIIILQDVSSSINRTFASSEAKQKYLNDLKKFKEDLSAKYNVNIYPFSQNILPPDSLNFNGKSTNLFKPIEQLNSLYSNQNVGAMILASDGLYNQGSNPVYQLSGISYPIYTLALGDSTANKDLRVDKIYHNEIIYLGDKFRVSADFVQTGYSSAQSTFSVLDITNNKTIISNEPVQFENNDYFNKDFIVEPQKSGIHHYRVIIKPLPDEITQENNFKDFFIEVIDSRQKILLLASAPHPDLTAIAQGISSNKNYEVAIQYANNFSANHFNNFSLVILHQIPSKNGVPPNLIKAINETKTALWFIVGMQTDINLLNQLQSCIQVKATNNLQETEVFPFTNDNFNLFTLNEKYFSHLVKMPPLHTPFGEYLSSATAKTLLWQKIGSVKTQYPLFSFESSLAKKVAVLTGEGIFRWRLYDYKEHKNFDFFNQFIHQTIQFLSVKEDKKPFKVKSDKNIFSENESINFYAEMYNESYELVNSETVQITITDENGNSNTYYFARSGKIYLAETPPLPSGNYTYSAYTKTPDKSYQYSGKFTVSPLQLEDLQTVANHQLLYQISEATQGNIFYPNQWENLKNTILENQKIASVMYDTFTTNSLINYKWLFFLILFFLSVEWFIRKFLGSY